MSFKYELPPNYELTPIPTDTKRKAECRRLVDMLETNKEALEKIDGLVGYGIGIANNNWCKVRIKLKFSHKFTQLQMFESTKAILALPGMDIDEIEGAQEKKPGGGAFSGQHIRPDKPK